MWRRRHSRRYSGVQASRAPGVLTTRPRGNLAVSGIAVGFFTTNAPLKGRGFLAKPRCGAETRRPAGCQGRRQSAAALGARRWAAAPSAAILDSAIGPRVMMKRRKTAIRLNVL